LNSAVRAPPIWRKPVGEGAKRVTTGSVITTAGQGQKGHAQGAVVYSRKRA
jgi:hypothetical protein